MDRRAALSKLASGAARVIACNSTTVLANDSVWTGFMSLSTVCILNMSSFTNLNNGTFRLEVVERRLCSNGVRTCGCCVGQFRRFAMGSNTIMPLNSGSFTVPDTLCN